MLGVGEVVKAAVAVRGARAAVRMMGRGVVMVAARRAVVWMRDDMAGRSWVDVREAASICSETCVVDGCIIEDRVLVFWGVGDGD